MGLKHLRSGHIAALLKMADETNADVKCMFGGWNLTNAHSLDIVATICGFVTSLEAKADRRGSRIYNSEIYFYNLKSLRINAVCRFWTMGGFAA